MSLDYHVTKPIDLQSINVNSVGELLWWSYILNVTPEKLVTLVERLGTSTEVIRKHLRD
jgi:hypothetical protein